MITSDQYEKMLPYKSIIDLFMKTGNYMGGGAGLICLYEDINNVKMNRRCSNCIADMLTICYFNLKNYIPPVETPPLEPETKPVPKKFRKKSKRKK